MLRKTRIILAVAVFVLITGLFLDFTGTLHVWFGFLAKIQFLPALLALNVAIVVVLLLLTLIFGRIYCSVICPLGIFQDLVSHVSSFRKKKRYRFSYSPAKSWLRYGLLALFIVALIAGVGSFVALLAPYSAYGRIVSNLFAPIYTGVNNLMAMFAERIGSYAFYERDIWIRSLPTFIIAAVTFVVIAVLAWRDGRTYCNTICPVGTVLSFFARFSWLKVRIDVDKCNKCSLCSRVCKASCIDYKNHRVDYSRCVVCGNCIGNCHKEAISYGRPDKEGKTSPTNEMAASVSNSAMADSGSTTDTSRRNFLFGLFAFTATAAIAQEKKKVDGGLAVIEDKVAPDRNTPLTPPGSMSASNMASHCTGCQLCVSVCPNDVLRPSGDIMRLMQPTMSYERGYCRPECTKCSSVCPTGAIRPITKEEKSSIQLGHAVWIRKNCIPVTDGVSCGNCARHCPSGAISMVRMDKNDPHSLRIPAVNTSRCIGCGACENLCPARPFSAIYVEGHEVHSVV